MRSNHLKTNNTMYVFVCVLNTTLWVPLVRHFSWSRSISSKTAWKVFQQCPRPLHKFGEDEVPSPATISLAEQFVCKLYDPKSTSTSICSLCPVSKTESQCWYIATNKWCLDSAHHEGPLPNKGLETVTSDPSTATLTNQLWLAHVRRQVGPPGFNRRTSTG